MMLTAAAASAAAAAAAAGAPKNCGPPPPPPPQGPIMFSGSGATKEFPFRLDVNSPPKLLESAICGETKAAASFELQQRERPLTFAPPSLLPLPLPGSRETPSRFPENDFPVQPPPPPPTTSSAVGSSSAAAAAGFMVAKPRMRICFDPETEIPRLQQWFAENNHPSRQQVEGYVKELNSLEARKGRKPLDVNNVIYWFKNTRAAVKRTEMKTRALQDSILAVGPASAAAAAARLAAPPAAPGLSPAALAAYPTTGVGAVAWHWPWILGSQLGKAPLPPLNHISSASENSSGLRSDSSPPHACGVAKAEATVSSNGEGCNACGNQDDQKDSSPSQGYKSSNSGSPPSPRSPLAALELPPPSAAKYHLTAAESISTLFRKRHHSGSPAPALTVPPPPPPLPPAPAHTSFPPSSAAMSPGAAGVIYSMSQFINPFLQMANSSAATSPIPAPPPPATSSPSFCHSSPSPEALAAAAAFFGVSDPSGDQRRKRNRTFIDPVTEVPRLEEWFLTNTHPSQALIARFTEDLNSQPYRHKFPRLEQKNIQFWFKNRRAKCKRMSAGSS